MDVCSQKRVPDAVMDEFMDEFMREMKAAFPKLLVQFEVRRRVGRRRTVLMRKWNTRT